VLCERKLGGDELLYDDSIREGKGAELEPEERILSEEKARIKLEEKLKGKKAGEKGAAGGTVAPQKGWQLKKLIPGEHGDKKKGRLKACCS